MRVLIVAISSYLLIGCMDEVLDTDRLSMEGNNTSEVLLLDPIVVQEIQMLHDYVRVVDNRWALDISLDNAIRLGVDEKNYNNFLSSMQKANEAIEEAERDSCFIKLNLPQNASVNSIIRIKTRAREGGGEGDVGRLLANMSPNSEVGFSSPTVRVQSHVFVQSIFFYTFRIHDVTWNEGWGESGVGPANHDHTWTCKLGGAPYSFKFSNTCSDTDGTAISYSFFTN